MPTKQYGCACFGCGGSGQKQTISERTTSSVSPDGTVTNTTEPVVVTTTCDKCGGGGGTM